MIRGEKKKIALRHDYKMRLQEADFTHLWTPSAKIGQVACHAHKGKLANDIYIEEQRNYVDIRIGTTWHDHRRRSDICLDALRRAEDARIVRCPFTSLSGLSNAKRTDYFSRSIRDNWVVAAYEHDLVIDPFIGNVLLREIEPYDVSGTTDYRPTIYLSGFDSSYRPLPDKVLVYPMHNKHGIDAIKIEVVLRGASLKKKRADGTTLRSPVSLGTQPEIQSIITPNLKHHWRDIFTKAEEATELLARSLGVSTVEEMFDALLDPARTLTSQAQFLAGSSVLSPR